MIAQAFSATPGLAWRLTMSGSRSAFGRSWDFPALSTQLSGLYFGVGLGDSGVLTGAGTPGFAYSRTGLPEGELVVYGRTREGGVSSPAAHNSAAASHEEAIGVVVQAIAPGSGSNSGGNGGLPIDLG